MERGAISITRCPLGILLATIAIALAACEGSCDDGTCGLAEDEARRVCTPGRARPCPPSDAGPIGMDSGPITTDAGPTDAGTATPDASAVDERAVLGITTVGSSVNTTAHFRAMPFTAPSGASLETLVIYHQAGSGRMRLGVYDGTARAPGTLLATTEAVAVAATEGWQAVDLPAPVRVSAGQTIWLAWLFETNPGVPAEPGSPGRFQSEASWASLSGALPSTFPSGTSANWQYSIHARYAPADRTDPPIETWMDEGFESGYGRLRGTSPRVTVECNTTAAHTGSCGLQMHYEVGTGGAIRDFFFSDLGVSPRTEFWTRYWVKFSSNFGNATGPTYPGPGVNIGKFGSMAYGRFYQCDNSAGRLDWLESSVALHDRQALGIQGANYFHVDAGPAFDINTENCSANATNLPWPEPQGLMERERWHCIEIFRRINVPGRNDGIIETYKNEELMLRTTNARYLEAGTTVNDDYQFIRTRVGGGVGGSWRSDREMYMWMDDFALGDERIGCGSTPTR